MASPISSRLGGSISAKSLVGEKLERTGLYKAALLNGQAFWGEDGTMLEQFQFYLMQRHPLFAMCFGHRHHPISRCERFLVLATTLMLQLSFSVMIGEAFGPADSQSQIQAREAFVAGLFVAIIMSIVGIFLNLAATLDDRLFGSRSGGILKALFGACGSMTLGMLFFMAACILAVVASIFTESSGAQQPFSRYVYVFGLSLAQSWTYVFVASSIFGFCMRRRSDIKKAEAQNKKHLETKAKWDAEQAEIDAEEAKATAAGLESSRVPVEAKAAEIAAVVVVPSASYPETAPSASYPEAAPSASYPEAAPSAPSGQGGMMARISGFVDRTSEAVTRSAAATSAKMSAMADAAKAKAGEMARKNPLMRLARPRTKVIPPFTLSFTELQRWGTGADIDAEYAASSPTEPPPVGTERFEAGDAV